MSPPPRILAFSDPGATPAPDGAPARWRLAIAAALRAAGAAPEFELDLVAFDDLFAAAARPPATQALQVLRDLSGGQLPEDDAEADDLRRMAAPLAAWLHDQRLREATRERLADALAGSRARLVLAEGLAGALLYDAARRGVVTLARRDLATLQGPLACTSLRAHWGGRLESPGAAHWYHLHNPRLGELGAPLRIADPRCENVDCAHPAVSAPRARLLAFLGHPAALRVLWPEARARAASRTRSRRLRRDLRAKPPARRALLVGIDAYPHPEHRLEGCVADVYQMSALLQESGYAPEDIRIVLDGRATAHAVRERTDWLLDGTAAGDQRFLFFSGHGAQVADYGPDERVDHRDECLVPYDFDWSRERALTDDWFHEVYSQLPYGCEFTAMLDCCHSGGMTRAGGGRPRGLSPPDDLRHRALSWDSGARTWVARDLPPANRDLGPAYTGSGGSLRRLGRAVALLPLNDQEFDAARTAHAHHGPYLPLLLQGCAEHELAFEHRQGAQSHGAFTWSLVREVRAARTRGRGTLRALMAATARHLREVLGYAQTPQAVGPNHRLERSHPWSGTAGKR